MTHKRSDPRIEQVMTRGPLTIEREQSLAVAHQIMRQHDIRHLPVMHAGKLVGLVSQRDLHLLETLEHVDPEAVAVNEAMSQDVYTVPPRTALSTVAAEMAANKYGAVVVLDKQGVVGIFTAVDGMRVLAEALEQQKAAPH